jgi:hypothetical protein
MLTDKFTIDFHFKEGECANCFINFNSLCAELSNELLFCELRNKMCNEINDLYFNSYEETKRFFHNSEDIVKEEIHNNFINDCLSVIINNGFEILDYTKINNYSDIPYLSLIIDFVYFDKEDYYYDIDKIIYYDEDQDEEKIINIVKNNAITTKTT